MTIIEQIKAEIGRRIKENESWKDLHRSKGETTNFDDVKIVELQSVLSFLSTLESEKPIPADLEEAANNYLDGIYGKIPHSDSHIDIFIHGAKWGAEHLASIGKTSPKDLEKAARRYSIPSYMKNVDENFLDEYPYDKVSETAFISGAKWQKEQMMEGAIPCKVFWHDGPLLDYTQEQQDNALERIGANVGDKVKIIIVKEN